MMATQEHVGRGEIDISVYEMVCMREVMPHKLLYQAVHVQKPHWGAFRHTLRVPYVCVCVCIFY